MCGRRRQPTRCRRSSTTSFATEIGSIAKPDVVQWAPGLPKTRSGKIMRRILRKIAEDELDNLGDTTTLADPAVVDDLVANRGGRCRSVTVEFHACKEYKVLLNRGSRV
ncbi:MAG: hypothetical protein U5O39_02680 [Gammaproteobacteria bacterium]|nr:hypothetical protein [Gammaproteobacteria bacterium]